MNQEIVDILRAPAATFTVDLSGPLDVAVTPTFNEFQLPGGAFKLLQQNDNPILQSVWIVMPYCFCVSVPQFDLVVRGRDNALVLFDIPQYASVNIQWIPVENCETALNVFIPFTVSPTNLPWSFMGEVGTGRVSMQNVPVALDTEELIIYAYLKIAHNLPLV